jgi:hypothetical protein
LTSLSLGDGAVGVDGSDGTEASDAMLFGFDDDGDDDDRGVMTEDESLWIISDLSTPLDVA